MKKIMGIIVFLCLIIPIIPVSSTIFPNLIEDPQITDASGDAFGYIDIDSIWFFEKEDTPEFLYVSMKINGPSEFTFQQTFAVFWKCKDIQYSCGLLMGFSLAAWKQFNVIIYDDKRYDEIIDVNGTYDFETGVITWMIPKEIIGNPQAGDVLTDTWSNAFRRLGLIGRMGLTRTVLDMIILLVFGNNMWDYAPDRGGYGLDYVIEY